MIRNALDATTHQRVSGQLGNRGTLAATFGNVLSSQARAAAFAEVQDMSRQQMAARLKSILDSEIAGIKKQRSRDLDGQRVVFDQARAALITRQDVERGKVREAWKLIYADRDRARSPYQQRSQQPAPIERKERPHRGMNAEAYRDRYQRPEPRQRAQAVDKKPWQDAPAKPEQKPMTTVKVPFGNFAEQQPAQIAQTIPAFVPQAQPAPSPSGDVPKPAPTRLQEVPKQEPAAPAFKRLADAKRDFVPATAKPAAIEKRKDWGQNRDTIQQPQQFKRLPKRDRDRDPEPER